MTSSADPHDPRPIIIGVGFAVVLLAGALFTVFLQTWDSRWPGPAQKPDRLGFAEKVLQNGDDATAAKIFSELAAEDNGMAQYWLAHMTELGLGVSRVRRPGRRRPRESAGAVMALRVSLQAEGLGRAGLGA